MKSALITGASSGIGTATAQELANHGLRVALVARRQDCLELELLFSRLIDRLGPLLLKSNDIRHQETTYENCDR